jgi:protein-S-isoprenylcysteine O-methyltransferase Ste14
MPSPGSLVLLALLWLSYFLIHSWLASVGLKYRVANHYPHLTPWYRLIFNAQAVVLLIPPLGYMWHLPGELLWEWRGLTAWIAYGLTLLALGAFVWSLRFYDSGEFLGLRQLRLRIHDIEDQELFHISPLHRYVRHPWYALGLIMVWTQEMDPARLLSAMLITLYFIIGSRIEEEKLLIYHGDVYREYRQQVPGLIPRPWRWLSRAQASELLARRKRVR